MTDLAARSRMAGERLRAFYPLPGEPVFLLLVAFNLFAITGDIVIAHSFNEFALWTQYIPLGAGLFSATTALVVALRPREGARPVFLAGMLVAIVLGAVGLWWHGESQLARGVTLMHLVYTAPLVAPLAYTGVALVGLVVIARRDTIGGLSKRRWLSLLVGAGSLANALLCVLDHARNAFVVSAEWASIPVALLAGTAFVWAAGRDTLSAEERLTLWVALALQFAAGLVGWGFHVYGSLAAENGTLVAKIIYGPPPFSPLLFCNMSVFGAALLVTRFAGERKAEADM